MVDFSTMRENCIQIHQQVYELLLVGNHIGIDVNLKVKEANELKSHPDTKTWDGMGRFSKEVYDNNKMWDLLPEKLWITLPFNSNRIEWVKEKARSLFLDSFYSLGGNNLYKTDKVVL